MGPLRGGGNCVNSYCVVLVLNVEKMGPLRGDGNLCSSIFAYKFDIVVEKMDPLRGRIKLLVQYRTKNTCN